MSSSSARRCGCRWDWDHPARAQDQARGDPPPRKPARGADRLDVRESRRTPPAPSQQVRDDGVNLGRAGLRAGWMLSGGTSAAPATAPTSDAFAARSAGRALRQLVDSHDGGASRVASRTRQRRSRDAAGRSAAGCCVTYRPPSPPAISTICAGSSAIEGSRTSASPPARSSARPTPTCSRAACARWSSMASSTPSPTPGEPRRGMRISSGSATEGSCASCRFARARGRPAAH